MDRLSELQTFVAVVDSGSFAAAARRLRRSPPAVTRLLSALEQRLGVVLLHRSSRRCDLTESGAILLPQARRILASYDDALAEVSGNAASPAGAVRLTASLTFGRDHVAPALTDFLDDFPLITAELYLSDTVLDLADEGLDLAVRIGPLLDRTLIARKLGEVRRMTVASPDYIRERGQPSNPAEVALHDVIQHSSIGADVPWHFSAGGTTVAIAVTPRFTVNQADAAVSAARSGRGLVNALSYQVHADILAGRLVPVLREFEPPAAPVSLVYPQPRRAVRRVRMLADYLASKLGRLDVLAPSRL